MVGMRRVILAVMATALVVCLAWMGGEAHAAGSVSLDTPGGTYTQDFNSLAPSGTSSTVPTGWHFLETGTNGNLTFAAGNGSSNAGDTLSLIHI